jgi:signal transduction histidine kinase
LELGSLLVWSVAAVATSAGAAEHATEAEAESMVKSAIAMIGSAGPQAAYKAITDHPGGAFKDRDLYLWVYDFQGNCLAHGANSKMVGKNLLAVKDGDGHDLVKEQLRVAQAGGGWYGPFKFLNRSTMKMDQRKAYCVRGSGETMVCAGVTATH